MCNESPDVEIKESHESTDPAYVARATLTELRAIRQGQAELIEFLTGLTAILAKNPLLGLRKFGAKS
jgi:hypothetical protein